MSEELTGYYNRELTFLRRMGAEFAAAHPKIAGRLRLGAETIEDPHVGRLVEAAAFLNARTRRKLDDDFPELTDALLGALYPHYLAPVPSMAIVQFETDPELTAPYEIAAGSMVETDRSHGEPCRYRTAYPVTALPVKVEAAELQRVPFKAPTTPRSTTCAAVLRLVLKTTGSAGFGDLAPERLRFFLKGETQVAQALYELLFSDLAEVAVACSASDAAPQVLGKAALQPVGFGRDEGLLPYPGRSFRGYRLLTEYFSFPSKFLFCDLTGLAPAKLKAAKDRLELYFYFARADRPQAADLQDAVDASSFALGCTPVVNLFPMRAEPIRLTATESQVHVVPDARRPLATEVYSIDDVVAAAPDGREVPFRPFFDVRHDQPDEEGGAFWHAVRRDSPVPGGATGAASTQDRKDSGSEVSLCLVDLDYEATTSEGWVLDTQVTCLNRDLPNFLPFGGDQPRMQLSQGGGPVKRVRCLTAPTPTRRPQRGRAAMWKLVSHLSLNHLSLTEGDGTEALREILRLYEGTGARENQAVVQGLVEVRSRQKTLRTQVSGQPGLCRGNEVTLVFDESRFAGGGLFLFASVLERFLALYGALNSFVQLSLTTTQSDLELHRWAPRVGDRALL